MQDNTTPKTLARFETGAVRSADLAGRRFDLIPWHGLDRLAATMAEGCAKYGPRNWEKGIPQTDLINHALAHLARYLHGDASEDHLAHAAANLFFAMHNEEERPELLAGLRRQARDAIVGGDQAEASTPPPAEALDDQAGPAEASTFAEAAARAATRPVEPDPDAPALARMLRNLADGFGSRTATRGNLIAAADNLDQAGGPRRNEPLAQLLREVVPRFTGYLARRLVLLAADVLDEAPAPTQPAGIPAEF